MGASPPSSSSSHQSATPELLRDLARAAGSRLELVSAFLNAIEARTVAEVGVYRGEFAAHVLDNCPSIERYYMIDPWRHLDDWNKPANKGDRTFQRIYQQAMDRTREHEGKRVVLRGRTTEVVDRIPDGGLDFAYIDGDHTLRGITVDLVQIHPKIREGGWIGGDDFYRSMWFHGEDFEPTMVFPFAVYFAEAVSARAFALPHGQFLMEKRSDGGFGFDDLTGKYGELALVSHMSPRRPPSAQAPEPAAEGGRGSTRAGRVRARLRRYWRRSRSG
jgi:Methyltransferase domain